MRGNCTANLAKVEGDAEVEKKITGELWVGVHDGLQIVDGDLVQVTVGDGAQRVQRLAGLARLGKVRLFYVLAKYVVLTCDQHRQTVFPDHIEIVDRRRILQIWGLNCFKIASTDKLRQTVNSPVGSDVHFHSIVVILSLP